MARLDQASLELLDFLCGCAHRGVRVQRVKDSCKSPLRRLRYHGLVAFDGFIPSPSAMQDWQIRRATALVDFLFPETPVGALTPRSTEPPEPEAVDEGGGEARKVAPPPKPDSPVKHAPAGGEVADEPRPPRTRGTQGASGTSREDPGAEESTSATRIKDRAPTQGAGPAPEERGLNETVSSPPAPPRRDPTLPPSTPLMDYAERERMLAARAVQATKRRIRAQAQKALDAGIPAGKASKKADIRGAMKELVETARIRERLNDPIEQAKTVLRRRYSPVVAAEFADPPGPKGKYLVGRKLVSKQELLEMASRLAA